MPKHSFPRRGSVYLVRLDPAFGHEIKKIRPAVVISNDHMNELASTILIMPITGGHYSQFGWILLHLPEGGLTKPSSIVSDQIKSIDKRRLIKQTGSVSVDTMAKIEQAIRDHCGLPEGGILP